MLIRVSKPKLALLLAAAMCVYAIGWYVLRSHACRQQVVVLDALAPKTRSIGFRPVWPRFLDQYLPDVGPLWRLAAVRHIGLSGADERDLRLVGELPYLEELVLEDTDVGTSDVILTVRSAQIRSLTVSPSSFMESEVEELRQALPEVDIDVPRRRWGVGN